MDRSPNTNEHQRSALGSALKDISEFNPMHHHLSMSNQGNSKENFPNNHHPSSFPSLPTGKEMFYADKPTYTPLGNVTQNINSKIEPFEGMKKATEFRFIEEPMMEPTNATKYVDPEYPSRSSSEYKKYTWLRPEAFFKTKNFVLFDKIELHDIDQGSHGDCYILAALSSLAEVPERIKKVFVTQEVNDTGRYVVRVCDMGEWKEIVVDDRIPCSKSSGKPAFVKPNGKELWVLLLEKVWSKIYGSYDNIESGHAVEAFKDLTGAPTIIVKTDVNTSLKKSELWRDIVEAEQKHYPMVCSTSVKQEKNGIRPRHAYSLLAASEVMKDGKLVRLVKMRNPWARKEWEGAWSDDSGRRYWTEELKKKLLWKNDDDGIFFMDFEDFLDHFKSVHFCYIKNENAFKSIRVRSKDREVKLLKLRVNQSGEYYISVNQESERLHQNDGDFDYSKVYLKLAEKESERKYKFNKGKVEANKEMWVKSNLKANTEYLIVVEVDWDGKSVGDFVVNSYGPADVTFELANERVRVKEQGDYFTISE